MKAGSISLPILFLFKLITALLVPLPFHVSCRDLQKTLLGFWVGLHCIYRFIEKELTSLVPVHEHSMTYLFISVFIFLSAFSSFQDIDLPHVLLDLYLSVSLLILFLLLISRNTIDFCMLTLYSVTVLKSVIVVGGLFVNSLGFFHMQSYHLWINTPLFLPFQSDCLLFLFLNQLVKNSSWMLNRSDEREYPCFVSYNKGEIIFHDEIWC